MSANKLILYTDGGCRPSRGCGGYGIHGYMHNDTIDTVKGSGIATHVPTALGYLEKTNDNKKSMVSILKYIDAWGSYKDITTNSAMELYAALRALQIAFDLDVVSCIITTDSTYILDGITKYLQVWKTNGWKKAQGGDVENIDLWMKVDETLALLKYREVSINVKWVERNSGDFGNVIADSHATKGVHMSRKKIIKENYKLSDPKGYWSITSKYNRLISKNHWYFITNNKDSNVTIDGRYSYHFANHHEKDDLHGKPISDNSFSVVYLKEKDEPLEALRAFVESKVPADEQHVIVGRIDALTQPKHYVDILNHNVDHLDMKDSTFNVISYTKSVLAKRIFPPMKSYQAIEEFRRLEELLLAYLNPDVNCEFETTDITDCFYEPAKLTISFKKELNTTVKYITAKIKLGKTVKTMKLIFDLDLPSRNLLSAITKQKPCVYVITWKEGEGIYRRASIVKTEDDIGIYSSVYSNITVVGLNE